MSIYVLRSKSGSSYLNYSKKAKADYKDRTGKEHYEASRTDPIMIDIIRSLRKEDQGDVCISEIPERFQNHYEFEENEEGYESLRILFHKYQVDTIAAIHAQILTIMSDEGDAATKLEKVGQLHAKISDILKMEEINYVW